MRSRKLLLVKGCAESHAGDMTGKKENGGEMVLYISSTASSGMLLTDSSYEHEYLQGGAMPIIYSDDLSHIATVKGLRNVEFFFNDMRMNE